MFVDVTGQDDQHRARGHFVAEEADLLVEVGVRERPDRVVGPGERLLEDLLDSSALSVVLSHFGGSISHPAAAGGAVPVATEVSP